MPLLPLLAGPLPPDITTCLLTLDPPILFNFLSLGSNQLISEEIVVF
jgi:hypothetical protein